MKRLVEKGSVFVEAAIVLPILISFVLLAVDLARLSTEAALLDNAASQGLDIARTVADLDADTTSSGLTSAEILTEQAKYDQAISKVQTELTKLSSNSNLGTFTIKKMSIPGYPTPTLGQSREEALAKKPIALEVTKNFVTSFPLSLFTSAIPVTGRAVGYREPKGYRTEPTPLDCAGNLVKSGVPPVTVGCKCPSSDHFAATYNFNAKACSCNGNSKYVAGINGAKGACTCLGLSVPKTINATTMDCICPLNSTTCLASMQFFNSGTCTCDTCSGNWQATTTGCNLCPSTQMQTCFDKGKTFIPSWCDCNQPCYNGSTLDPTKPEWCKCTAAENAAVIGTRTYFDWECRKYDCCGGATVCDLRSNSSNQGRSCSCPAKPTSLVCKAGESYMQVGNECKCACSSGGIWMDDGQGHAMCTDPVCKVKQCSWNESAGKFTPSE